jgi:hypothetical protein
VFGFIRLKPDGWWFCKISEDHAGKGRVSYVAPVADSHKCRKENQVYWAKIEHGTAVLK